MTAARRRSPVRIGAAALAACCLGSMPVAAQTLTNGATSLNFGTFFANSGGTVTLDPVTGTRSASGPTLLTAYPFSLQTFTVTNTTGANRTYEVSFTSATISLTRSGGTETMSLTLASSPSTGLNGKNGWGVLTGNGTQTLTVGGTLTVSASQVPGAYSGSYAVTVLYQ